MINTLINSSIMRHPTENPTYLPMDHLTYGLTLQTGTVSHIDYRYRQLLWRQNMTDDDYLNLEAM